MRDVCPVCHQQDKLHPWQGALPDPLASHRSAHQRPDSGRAGDGLVTAEAGMLASEPDPTLPTPPVFLPPRKRTTPRWSGVVLIPLAVLLSLWFFFGLLTTLANAWAGWDGASWSLLLVTTLSGLGALVCLWLSWRLNSNHGSRNGLAFTRDAQRAHAAPFGKRGQDPDLLYCERDHVLFKPMTHTTDPAVVNETPVT